MNNTSSLLLDSSLNIQTRRHTHPSKNYDTKVIKCGNYIQVYFLPRFTSINNKLWTKEKNKIDTDSLKRKNQYGVKKIELKNAIRSKLQCQRLAKANAEEWETFITLTFKDIVDIEVANAKFNIWRTKVASIKKGFKYIAVPEYQKRGSIHFHVLTNISIFETNIIIPQVELSGKAKLSKKEFYNVKYWKYGFSSVEVVKSDLKKVIGYISKYMTKDIDDRLFGRNRYLSSRNLIKPVISYIDKNEESDIKYFDKLLDNSEVIYNNEYLSDNGESIFFIEYLTSDNKGLG